MNHEYAVFLRKDEWEDVIDFIGLTSFDDNQTDELHAYGIQLIEAIKEQIEWIMTYCLRFITIQGRWHMLMLDYH